MALQIHTFKENHTHLKQKQKKHIENSEKLTHIPAPSQSASGTCTGADSPTPWKPAMTSSQASPTFGRGSPRQGVAGGESGARPLSLPFADSTKVQACGPDVLPRLFSYVDLHMCKFLVCADFEFEWFVLLDLGLNCVFEFWFWFLNVILDIEFYGWYIKKNMLDKFCKTVIETILKISDCVLNHVWKIFLSTFRSLNVFFTKRS